MYRSQHVFEKSKKMADAIRVLAMDAVQQAKSGHPGMPMGMADVATVLASSFLKFNPNDPTWADRDRFILSAGHGSMLLYALSYLTGYSGMTIESIRKFRQLGSHTDGHPELNPNVGIEMTTGPLGQGFATSVGFALGERIQNARISNTIIDHYTYVMAGDGCLMEGISQEALSLAGHLKLGKLIVLFDDNSITIDGKTDLSTSDDVRKRFEASNWHVQKIDGHNHQEIFEAITAAKDNRDQPSLICFKTSIAFGSPNKANTSSAHGAPLGEEEIALTRQNLGWTHGPFDIPDDILSSWRKTWVHNEKAYTKWQKAFNHCDDDVQNSIKGKIPVNWKTELFELINAFTKETPTIATRQASGKVLEILTAEIEELIGGSADLSGSNNTKTSSSQDIAATDYSGNYINYGIREHAMAALMNGLSLHGGFIPYAGTFLVFADYARPAMRLSALMKQQIIYVMTHDSIGLGEDGPTHQPIEHLASLRSMPNMQVFRPGDAVETAECWMTALETTDKPSVIALSRQSTPNHRHNFVFGENLSKHGGYVLRAEPNGIHCDLCIIATGTEVDLALQVQKRLESDCVHARVISMPCVERFLEQPQKYQEKTLGDRYKKPIFVIEAASTFGWERLATSSKHIFGIDSFGASAPAPALYEHFGLTVDAIVPKIKSLL